MSRRAFIIVIDALGVGAMPDAASYGDAPGANTLGSIDAHADRLHLPVMASLGLGHLFPMRHVPAVPAPTGAWGKMAERSKGKDTTTGHWEMMGMILDEPFPTYPEGFPPEVIEAFIAQTGCGGVLGNKPASGTQILDELGEQHLETGWPIVYTSADSVFQIACHVDKIPLETLYNWCHIARQILRGTHEVSRVIARPFTGARAGQFKRLGDKRHDYAVLPPADNVLTRLQQAGVATIGVGKISDIFCAQGITHSLPTQSNAHGLAVTEQLITGPLGSNMSVRDEGALKLEALRHQPQLVFVNLVETDMNYGHRRDVDGYARALEAIDTALAHWLPLMQPDDLLMISADHGCDPTAPGSDHTREYVPLLCAGGNLSGQDLGTRATFADIGQTALKWLVPQLPELGKGLPGVAII
ncbi:MAG: phosphopentomutase [Vampirovibrionales bacterium]|nr:phosphopentomutase [Vampirovibrionales bacterium]